MCYKTVNVTQNTVDIHRRSMCVKSLAHAHKNKRKQSYFHFQAHNTWLAGKQEQHR